MSDISKNCLQFIRVFVSPEERGLNSEIFSELAREVESGKNLKQAFQRLPQSEQKILQDKIGKSPLKQILSISQESDAELCYEALLNFGVRLKADDEVEKAMAVFNVLGQGEGSVSEYVRTKAQGEYQALVGQGSVGMRMEYLAHRFARDALDFRVIAPMIGASLIGNVVGGGTVGYLAEVPTFALLNRGLAEGKSDQPFRHDLATSAMTLGAIRLAGLSGNYLFSKVSGIQTLPASVQNLLTKFQQYLLPQVNMFVGLTASHKLEEFAELRPHLDNATFFTDTLSSMVSLGVGSHLGHKVLGLGGSNIGYRQPEADPPLTETSNIENSFLASRSRRHPALHPLLAPMWAMLGAGGLGGGGGGEAAQKNLGMEVAEHLLDPSPEVRLKALDELGGNDSIINPRDRLTVGISIARRLGDSDLKVRAKAEKVFNSILAQLDPKSRDREILETLRSSVIIEPPKDSGGGGSGGIPGPLLGLVVLGSGAAVSLWAEHAGAVVRFGETVAQHANSGLLGALGVVGTVVFAMAFKGSLTPREAEIFQKEIPARMSTFGGEEAYLKFLEKSPEQAAWYDVEFLGMQLIDKMENKRPSDFAKLYNIFQKVLYTVGHLPNDIPRTKHTVMKYLHELVMRCDPQKLEFYATVLRTTEFAGINKEPLLGLFGFIQEMHPQQKIRDEAQGIEKKFLKEVHQNTLAFATMVMKTWTPEKFFEEMSLAAREGNDSKVIEIGALTHFFIRGQDPQLLPNLLAHPYPLVRLQTYGFLEYFERLGKRRVKWERFWVDYERIRNAEDRNSSDPFRRMRARNILEMMANHGVEEAQVILARLYPDPMTPSKS